MNWLFKTLISSIGKKLMMALTGLSFIGFLTVHLAGNLTLFGGGKLFNAYAEHLHSLGPLINVAEIVLLALFTVHVLTGLMLFIGNLSARPERYMVNKNAGGRTIASGTMPYTGLLILGFIIMHLINFHFVDKTDRTIFEIVSTAFANPAYIGLYVIAMIMVAVHVSHGLWSAFQTVGVNHVKYSPGIRSLSILLGVVFGAGFGLLPIFVCVSLNA